MLFPREYIVRRKGTDFISCQFVLFPQGTQTGFGYRVNFDGLIPLYFYTSLEPLIFHHKTIWTF